MKPTHKIAWNKISYLPADGIIYTGSPEMGTLRACHTPCTSTRAEQLLAETPVGLFRKLPLSMKTFHVRWGQAQHIAGTIEQFTAPTGEGR